MDTLLSTPLRAYSKTELAQILLPHISPASAENRLMMWVNRNPDLVASLQALGYSKRQKYLTPPMVRLIAEALVF